jgi:AraC family transcriptional regulator
MHEKRRLAHIFRGTANAGEWYAPAIKHLSVGISLAEHRSECRVGGVRRVHHVQAGHVALCPYDESRSYVLDRPVEFAVIVLSDSVVQQVSEGRHRHLPEMQTVPSFDDSTVTRLAQIMVQEWETNHQNGPLFADSVTIALAQYLYNRYAVLPYQDRCATGGLSPSALRKSIDYMHGHLHSAIYLKDLARETGISTAHYARMFRQSTGITPHQYLLRQRVERARDLIENQPMRLAEVALTCGFADQQHMARVFRQMTGLSPKAFRKRRVP